MPPFDYNAPAELFLSKPAKGKPQKVSLVSATGGLRRSVMPLRTLRISQSLRRMA